MTDAQTIAKTIIDQMGGIGPVMAFTGTRQFIAVNNGVYFQFPNRERSKPNAVRITLEPSDTYTVQFLRVSTKGLPRLLKTCDDIYCDQLVDIFESNTGLYLHF